MPRSRSHDAFLARREGDISLRPSARPIILIAIEGRRPHPVVERKLAGIANAHTALFGGVDQKDAAERPERLAAERLFGLLIDNNDLFLCVDQFDCGDKAGKSGTDDNYVRIKGHRPASPGDVYRELDAWGTRSSDLSLTLPAEDAAAAIAR